MKNPELRNVDLEKFRLRRFAEELVATGECRVHEEPIALIDVAAVLDGAEEAVWFKAVGPERAELIGNVMGSRRRIAQALSTSLEDLGPALRARSSGGIAPIEVDSAQAPVQEVVLEGEDADLCNLPVHLQHAFDGAPYISAGIDFALDVATGWTNIGCRRMMLRGPREAGIDTNAPSDLRAMYLRAAARGERLPIAFVVGSHPLDFLASLVANPPMDELHVIGAMRGEPVPVVKCRTIDVMAPADAEFVLEGYLDERGMVEPEGPYGEYVGYYGVLKKNPVFHLTAITHRRDALFQTVTIGGSSIARTDTAVLAAVKTETAVWTSLLSAVREPIAVCATASSGGMFNVRVSIRQRVPGEARNAIAAVFGSIADVKHVFVFDEDVDVYSADHVDWALATRFQADRDMLTLSGFRAVPLDPSLEGARTGAKAGFDCTIPFGKRGSFEFMTPLPPTLGQPKKAGVLETLEEAPATFLDLMSASRSDDGREIVRELGRLQDEGRLQRLSDGKYALKGRTS